MISLFPLALLVVQAQAPKPTEPALPALKVKAGDLAPDFAVETPDGKPLRLSDFRGKVVLLDFWATWCGPCQIAMPKIQNVYNRFKDQNVVVLAVNVWDDRKPFEEWMEQNAGTKYAFTFGYDRKANEKASPEEKRAHSVARKAYGVFGIPTVFVIGKDGRIVETMVGIRPKEEEELTAALGKLGIRAEKS